MALALVGSTRELQRMRTAFSALFLILLPSIGLASAPFTAWQESAAWVHESLPAAIKSRVTWLALQDKAKYNESTCPYPGDATFQAQALPVFANPPAIYATYIPGQPEMFLDKEKKTVYYPIRCSDGTIGFVEMSKHNEKWVAVSHHLPTTGNAFTDLFSVRDSDIGQSHLKPENYFALLTLPVSVGGKLFSGSISLARQTATEFDVEAMYDVAEISIQRGIWIPADQVMQRLKAYQAP